MREAIDLVLAGHEPYPALVVDRFWDIVATNAAIPALLDGVSPALLEPPVNVLRVSLHPEGMAPRIANLGEWRAHLLERLERQIALTGEAAAARARRGGRGLPGARGRRGSPPMVAEAGDRRGDAAAHPRGRAGASSPPSPPSAPRSRSPPPSSSIESFFPADGETAPGAAGTTSGGNRHTYLDLGR